MIDSPALLLTPCMEIGDISLTSESVTTGELSWLVSRGGSGPPVFLVHGFPDTPYSFRYQVGVLMSAGFEVIVPFLPGYHPSSLARGKNYRAGNLGRDFASLIKTLGYEQVYFLGHDWGGIAGYQVAVEHPERIRKLVTVSIPQARGLSAADFAQLKRSRYMLFLQLPGSTALVRRNNFAWIDRLYREWSPGWNDNTEHIRAAKQCLGTGNTLAIALGYYRTMFRQSISDARVRKTMSANIPVPTMTITGKNDGCIGLYCMEAQAEGFDSDYQFVALDNAGHFPHVEQPSQFNEALLEFLS